MLNHLLISNKQKFLKLLKNQMAIFSYDSILCENGAQVLPSLLKQVDIHSLKGVHSQKPLNNPSEYLIPFMYIIPLQFQRYQQYFLIKQGFEETDFFKISHINVHTSLAKNWKLSDGNIITQIHPPLQSLRLDTPDGEIIASPFKKGKDTDDSLNMDDIRKIYHQNNYSNQILHTIATQVDSLSSEIKSIPKATTSRFPASYSAPHFQPSSFSKHQEAQLTRPTSSSVAPPSPLLHKISQTLDKINSNLPSSSRINTID
ncbi:hypothetical protein M9H77_28576 [Catharanthus roseus]|uniref:Uncharacterized protein n=1 Tax=Catharanthus roseus TaxID=4058 RepID=A0ACC0AK22_CATRO|nr:hypothetical protein M9H77_28576 [Catharanthus roseus]